MKKKATKKETLQQALVKALEKRQPPLKERVTQLEKQMEAVQYQLEALEARLDDHGIFD